LWEIDHSVPAGDPVVISITIGINDLDWLSPETILRTAFQPASGFENWVNGKTRAARIELQGLVQELLDRPNVAVVVTTYHNPMNADSFLFQIARRFGGCILVNCYLRSEYAVHRLNVELLSMYRLLGNPERLTTADIHSNFHGHESPKPQCGSVPPEVDQTWVQYFGDPESNSDPEIKWRGIRIPLPPGGDCFHPNEKGANAIAAEVDEAARRAGR
jgi:lysophospholipase L1-like esterase